MPFGISDKFETFGSFQKNQKEKPKQPLKSKMIALTTTKTKFEIRCQLSISSSPSFLR